MINTDAELGVVRDELRRAEAVLESTKRKFAHNPVQYDLFSAGIIDIIDSMRADIDAYLGGPPAREPAGHPTDQGVTPGAARP